MRSTATLPDTFQVCVIFTRNWGIQRLNMALPLPINDRSVMQMPFCLPLKSMFKYSFLAENLKVQLPHLYCICLCDKKKKQFPLMNCSSSAMAFPCWILMGPVTSMPPSSGWAPEGQWIVISTEELPQCWTACLWMKWKGWGSRSYPLFKVKEKTSGSNRKNSGRECGFIQYNIYSATYRLLSIQWHLTISVYLLSELSTGE